MALRPYRQPVATWYTGFIFAPAAPEHCLAEHRLPEPNGVASRAAQLLLGGEAAVDHDHGGAFLGKEAGFDLAHAARGSGNDGDFAFQPGHVNLPPAHVNGTGKDGL